MKNSIFVVIPAYRASSHVKQVVSSCLSFCDFVVVVDDSCPERSGGIVAAAFKDENRVEVLFNERNLGVGGATKRGLEYGFAKKYKIGVKVDGDGQISPSLIPNIVRPIAKSGYEYVKGNRFTSPESLEEMPKVRLIGNAGLALLSKLSTGYWGVSDPTNGFFAITDDLYHRLEPKKVANDFFFESDLLFRLGLAGARVFDLPMRAKYGDEQSSLRPWKVWPSFLFGHAKNTTKRILYSYFVKEWNVGTISLVIGAPLFLLGAVTGISLYLDSLSSTQPAAGGTLFLSAVPLILGLQLFLNFVNYDVGKSP